MKCSKPTVKSRKQDGGPNHGGTTCIITCHNYARFLTKCLESCITQSLPFAQIIVVDDASDDDTEVKGICHEASVIYLRGEWGDVVKARNHGVDESRPTQFLLFVDADNWLDKEFHEKVRKVMDDPHCGVAYGVLRRFDDLSGEPRGNLHMSFNYNALRKENYVDTCSLVRREAFDQACGWQPTPGARGLEDWALWLRITRLGWVMVRTPALFHYRMHKAQMSQVAAADGSFHRRNAYALASSATVSIITLMSGRTWALRQQVQAIKDLNWRKENLRWVCIDNSADSRFNRELWDTYLAGIKLPVTVVREDRMVLSGVGASTLADDALLRSSNAYAINAHLARLYAQARGLCAADSDFILCLEDDILPPPHTLTEMIWALQADRLAGVVSGCVMTRFGQHPHLLAWNGDWTDTGRMDASQHLLDAPPAGAIRRITASGFMCTLFRRQVWDAIAFRPSPLWTRSNCFYDWAAAHEVERLGWRWLLCGGVRCVHLRADGNNLHVPEEQHESLNTNPATSNRPRHSGQPARSSYWTPHARKVRTARGNEPRK